MLFFTIFFRYCSGTALANLDQGLQNIMGVNKARGGPTTPTTSGTLPTFPQVIPDQEVIPEVSGVLPGPDPQSASTSSRFQISPISDERPANLSFEPKGNGKFELCFFHIKKWRPFKSLHNEIGGI